ncbi:MAG: hypothetical protein J6Q92_02200 [Oscillospiraceae bacterium]|nr:hypothetical protein [Oscillospiraceae bacterium]
MKNPALRPLIKDVLIIGILGGFMAFVLGSAASVGAGWTWAETFVLLAVTGIPFGWRWAKKMFVAVSVKGFFIKVLWAALLGCIAIFVVVIGDIIRLIKSTKETPVE